MASLYGKLLGGRGQTTRTGTKASGIQSQVQTYKSAVRVELEHDDMCRIIIKSPDTGRSVTVWEGNAAEVVERGTLD